MNDIMQRGTKPRRKSKALPSPESLHLGKTALLLDVDGTILDIAATPTGVLVPEQLQATLRSLTDKTGGAVALVSGRTIDTLDRLFAPLQIPAIGGHGAEMRLVSGAPIVRRRPSPLSDVLRERLHALTEIDSRLLIEDKLHSIAIHYRLALQREALLKSRIAEIVADQAADQVEILAGKAVVEIKPKEFSKGSAVMELMAHTPFRGRSPIFIGDDTTDESVFAILPELSGTGFSVEKPISGADGVIPSPEHVRSWLRRLSEHAGRVQ